MRFAYIFNMCSLQLAAIKLLMSPAESDEPEAVFRRRTALLRAGDLLQELSRFMVAIGDQMKQEEDTCLQQVCERWLCYRFSKPECVGTQWAGAAARESHR